jgi:hypothetical protein
VHELQIGPQVGSEWDETPQRIGRVVRLVVGKAPVALFGVRIFGSPWADDDL